jgi:hypothetical protein
VSAVSSKIKLTKDKENKMAKYVAEVFNYVEFQEVQDGEIVEWFQTADSKSILFKSKSDAEKFIASATQSEKHITKIDSTCGCLEVGDDVELMMNFGDNTCAYCYDCS